MPPADNIRAVSAWTGKCGERVGPLGAAPGWGGGPAGPKARRSDDRGAQQQATGRNRGEQRQKLSCEDTHDVHLFFWFLFGPPAGFCPLDFRERKWASTVYVASAK